MPTSARKKSVAKKKTVKNADAANNGQDKSLESWIWDAACSIREAKDAPSTRSSSCRSSSANVCAMFSMTN